MPEPLILVQLDDLTYHKPNKIERFTATLLATASQAFLLATSLVRWTDAEHSEIIRRC